MQNNSAQPGSSQPAKKFKSLTIGDPDSLDDITLVKDELEKMNTLLKDIKQENEVNKKDNQVQKTPRKNLLQLFTNPPQKTPREAGGNPKSRGSWRSSASGIVLPVLDQGNEESQLEKKDEPEMTLHSIDGAHKLSNESEDILEARKLSNEFTHTIRKNSGTNIINLMKTQAGFEQVTENPMWLQLEDFMKNWETLADERDSLEEQLSQVREGAIEALMEKEETILDLMTKLRNEIERKSENPEKDGRQVEEEINRMYEENCRIREQFLSEKEVLEKRHHELMLELDNQKHNFERHIFRLEQERVPSNVVIELREQLAELRNRENELLMEIRNRDKSVHKLEKEKNDHLREYKENEFLQSKKIDEYEKKIVQLEKRLHSETWSNSSFEIYPGSSTSQSSAKQGASNQKKDPENEKKKILEENLILQRQVENLERKINDVTQKCYGLERENEKLLGEKDNFMQNIEELENVNEELTLYLEKTKENFEKSIMEVQEKSRNEILFLKHELKEQERSHSTQVENLNHKLANALLHGNSQNTSHLEKSPSSVTSLGIEIDNHNEMIGSYSLISPKHMEANKMFGRNGTGVEKKRREVTTEEDLARMRDYVKKSEERWSLENNVLREDIKLAESMAVESKMKLLQVTADKDFYMFKYNEILNQIESGTVGKPKAKTSKRSSIKNLFEEFKCKFAFSRKK